MNSRYYFALSLALGALLVCQHVAARKGAPMRPEHRGKTDDEIAAMPVAGNIALLERADQKQTKIERKKAAERQANYDMQKEAGKKEPAKTRETADRARWAVENKTNRAESDAWFVGHQLSDNHLQEMAAKLQNAGTKSAATQTTQALKTQIEYTRSAMNEITKKLELVRLRQAALWKASREASSQEEIDKIEVELRKLAKDAQALKLEHADYSHDLAFLVDSKTDCQEILNETARITAAVANATNRLIEGEVLDARNRSTHRSAVPLASKTAQELLSAPRPALSGTSIPKGTIVTKAHKDLEPPTLNLYDHIFKHRSPQFVSPHQKTKPAPIDVSTSGSVGPLSTTSSDSLNTMTTELESPSSTRSSGSSDRSSDGGYEDDFEADEPETPRSDASSTASFGSVASDMPVASSSSAPASHEEMIMELHNQLVVLEKSFNAFNPGIEDQGDFARKKEIVEKFKSAVDYFFELTKKNSGHTVEGLQKLIQGLNELNSGIVGQYPVQSIDDNETI